MTVKLSAILKLFVLAGVIVTSFSVPVFAQKREILGSFRDWDAILIERENGEKHCMMISMPKRTLPAGANRGEIYVTVTHRPRRRVMDQINIVMGYPLRVGSEVTVSIGGSRYNMFVEGRGAWHYDEDDDTRMVASMKRGNNLVVRGTSTRGTDTTDTYSLTGFTAAYNTITAACS